MFLTVLGPQARESEPAFGSVPRCPRVGYPKIVVNPAIKFQGFWGVNGRHMG